MENIVITGLNGTLAPKLALQFVDHGKQVIPWDRRVVDPNDIAASREFLVASRADIVCHLAMGNPAWAKSLAQLSNELGCKLCFTSTAMVFNHYPNGPHHVQDERNARDDYGRTKIACEDAIQKENPDSLVVRIGWQIDWDATGNNMYAALIKMHKQVGAINASQNWIPATSFMQDTCRIIRELLNAGAKGVYHMDSNQHDQLSFAQIAQRISDVRHQNWRVNKTYEYVHDQRLIENRIKIPNLSNHL